MDVEDISKLINDNDAVEFLKSLVQVNTMNPAGMEKPLVDLIKYRLRNCKFDIKSYMVEKGRENLIVSFNSETSKSKTLVFNGHFDTVPVGNVPWTVPILEGIIKDTRLYGRGSSDMKSGVAAMILAMEYIQKAGIKLDGNLQFIGTVGEEVDCIGSKSIINEGLIDKATAIVIGEPTSNQIVIAHKGALWLEISMYGKTAHGSMPTKGKNAIVGITNFVNELNKYDFKFNYHEILGSPTLNVGMINGGISPNIVPDYCKLTIDIRTVPGQNHNEIVNGMNVLLTKIASSLGVSFEIKELNNLVSVSTPSNHSFIQKVKETVQSGIGNDGRVFGGVNYYTDGSIFRSHLPNVPILIYGPGEPSVAHQPDEWVDIDKYLNSIRKYIALAINYLGRTS